jgi:large-conductance mechanosensitive channel
MRLDGPDRTRLAVIAVGVALGIAAMEVIRTFVESLLAPLIAVFVGESQLWLNEFTVKGVEFRYGVFLEAVLMAVVVALIACLVFPELLPERVRSHLRSRLSRLKR